MTRLAVRLRRFRRLFILLAVLGPGLITTNAGNDAGAIATYSQAGAEFGYQMLWILVLITVSLAVVNEMGARMGVVTGKGLADLIRSIHGSPDPVITMRFAKAADPKDPESMEGVLGPLEAAAMGSSRIKQLGERDLPPWLRSIGEVRNGAQIGDQIVAFEEARPDAFAMILITVTLKRPDPDAADALRHRIEVKVRFQRSPSAEDEKAALTVTWNHDLVTNDSGVLRRRFRKTCEELPGTFRTYLQSPIPDAQKR